jgi:hypothetical protein
MNWRVLNEVQEDLNAVARRLELERRGYGLAFSDLYDRALAAIIASPRQHSPTEDGPEGLETREVFIGRFNQRVICAVTDTEVVILAVEHAHRRPGSWVGRAEQV